MHRPLRGRLPHPRSRSAAARWRRARTVRGRREPPRPHREAPHARARAGAGRRRDASHAVRPLPGHRGDGARSVRHGRRRVRRPPRSFADPDARGLDRPPAPQGLRRRAHPGAVQADGRSRGEGLDEHAGARGSRAHRRGRARAASPQHAHREGAAARRGMRAAHLRGRSEHAQQPRAHRRSDDDHQHGAAAPEHPRRAAPHARARRRDGAAHQADHRLPPHRDGEDRRRAHVPAGRHQRHPHGLLVALLQRARLQPRDREAARRRGPAPCDLDPHAHGRAEPDVVAPALPRHQRHGRRRGVDAALRLARARGGAAVLRDRHRPADEPQLHPPWWCCGRPPARLARRRAPPARADPAAARRVRHPPHRAADLP